MGRGPGTEHSRQGLGTGGWVQPHHKITLKITPFALYLIVTCPRGEFVQ